MTNSLLRPAPKTSKEAKAFLRKAADRIAVEPLTNSVASLAHVFFLGLESNTTSMAELGDVIGDVHSELIEIRATRFRKQHFDANSSDGWSSVEQVLRQHAEHGFEHFKQRVEQVTGGIVFTAHPTFAISRTLRDAFAIFTVDPTTENRTSLRSEIKRDQRCWNAGITLDREHGEAQEALEQAAGAQSKYASLVLAVAQDCFPNDWKNLSPYLPTLASWVGYDLDGRTDIHWSQSIALRLSEKAQQLLRYANLIASLEAKHGPNTALDRLKQTLGRAAEMSAKQSKLFAQDLTEQANLVAAANDLTGAADDDPLNAQYISDALTEIIEDAPDELARDLMALRSQVHALQLGTAQIHLRVNAAQVRTVINRDLGLETEDQELGRLALAELSVKARVSEPTEVNFSDLFFEQSTARRQFMMCAQILKHIDSGSVIRFLIAESENPATVMGALYLARQYGVADQLDISPLFETPEALETGGRFIERLLEEPEFLRYIKRRGHLSIQLGFSDAGRFIGQVAANMAIERIHNLIIRALAKKANGVDLLIFNTHGESFGRGAWPGEFQQRFDHALTPWTRQGARARNLNLIHEVSFQGGDGFLHFASPTLAETSYAAWCNHALTDPGEAKTDPFYTRTDLVWDFYRSLRAWHEGLFENADYGHLLDAFSNGLSVKAGSRQKRRSGGPGGPRALRAISHNATLQQLAIPLNTAAGIGSSLQREHERITDLINSSPRMKGLVLLALHARSLTSLPALRGYASVYDPSVWIAYAKMTTGDRVKNYRAAYYALQDRDISSSLRRTANLAAIDLANFDALVAGLDNAPSTKGRHEARLTLHVLHAARQALMMHAISLAGSVPPFSERHDMDASDVIGLVADLQIQEAIDLLCKIFPRVRGEGTQLNKLTEKGSPAQIASTYGYEHVHADIIEPLAEVRDALHRISLAITHAYGAFG